MTPTSPLSGVSIGDSPATDVVGRPRREPLAALRARRRRPRPRRQWTIRGILPGDPDWQPSRARVHGRSSPTRRPYGPRATSSPHSEDPPRRETRARGHTPSSGHGGWSGASNHRFRM